MDRESPLRGYQASFSLTVDAGRDSVLDAPLARCGDPVPACAP